MGIESAALSLEERQVRKQKIFKEPYATPASALAFALAITLPWAVWIVMAPVFWLISVQRLPPMNQFLELFLGIAFVVFLLGALITWAFTLRRWPLVEEWALLGLLLVSQISSAVWVYTGNHLPFMGLWSSLWVVVWVVYLFRVWRAALQFRAEQRR